MSSRPVTKYQNNVTNKYTECGVTVAVGKPPRSFRCTVRRCSKTLMPAPVSSSDKTVPELTNRARFPPNSVPFTPTRTLLRSISFPRNSLLSDSSVVLLLSKKYRRRCANSNRTKTADDYSLLRIMITRVVLRYFDRKEPKYD